MTRLVLSSSMIVCLAFAAAQASAATVVDSFDEIIYWIGDGANKSALVIDWSEATGVGDSTVWGFRWDDAATGQDLLQAVVRGDERLYGKFDYNFARLFGLGYDKDQATPFGITPETLFDEQGIANVNENQADLAVATDPGDLYGEGWKIGDFWHYSLRPGGFDAAWASNPQGMGSHNLNDGDVVGWTFSTLFNYSSFPDDPLPAAAAVSPLSGDYNLDGVVDAADYVVWRDTLGDPASYAVWRENYGTAQSGLSVAPASASSTPEPASASLLIYCLLFLSTHLGRRDR
jgi:hypothetical protein